MDLFCNDIQFLINRIIHQSCISDLHIEYRKRFNSFIKMFWKIDWKSYLKSEYLWKGSWGDLEDLYCRNSDSIRDCNSCNNVPGFGFMPCHMCRTPKSQCYSVKFRLLDRFGEGHDHGYYQSVLCRDCFIKAKHQMIDLRINWLPKSLYDIMYKYLHEHWHEFHWK